MAMPVFAVLDAMPVSGRFGVHNDVSAVFGVVIHNHHLFGRVRRTGREGQNHKGDSR